MKQKFREIKLSKKNKEVLTLINSIIEEYSGQGYTLTLRQLYYQLVSRDIIPNEQKEYSKLSRILKEGRMSGMVDWNAIEDRLRQVRKVATWNSPKGILTAAKNQFQFDRLSDQDSYLEVWVEKDALSQVVERAAKIYQVPVLVNRGYGSISSMYETYKRVSSKINEGAEVTILYLGDHDPSGLDMVRDIKSRLSLMLDYDNGADSLSVKHIALTMDQINVYDPPPNPAKVSDPRAKDYIEQYGRVSWEVDALDPATLNQLITDHIEENIDLGLYSEWIKKEEKEKVKIDKLIKSL